MMAELSLSTSAETSPSPSVTDSPKAKGVTENSLLIFTKQSGRLKEEVAQKGAEISQRQEKIKFIHSILQAINKLADENGLDISNDAELQEKLKVAKEIGVDFDDTALKFSVVERDFLKESLLLTEEELANENKGEMQQMQKLIQTADHWLTMANLLLKNREKSVKSLIDKIR